MVEICREKDGMTQTVRIKRSAGTLKWPVVKGSVMFNLFEIEPATETDIDSVKI